MDDIAHFPGVRPQRPRLSYALKQLVSHEIELQKMRREDGGGGNVEDGKQLKVAASSAADAARSRTRERPELASSADADGGGEAAAEAAATTEAASTPRHLQKLQAKKINGKDMEERSPVDFFGRPIVAQSSSSSSKGSGGGAGGENIVSSDIWFKFKEGYNNAVRRLVRMSDLA